MKAAPDFARCVDPLGKSSLGKFASQFFIIPHRKFILLASTLIVGWLKSYSSRTIECDEHDRSGFNARTGFSIFLY